MFFSLPCQSSEECMKILCLIGIAMLLCLGAGAQTNSYTVTPIIDNTQDPNLVNPWGLSRPIRASIPENEWWTSDNVTGVTTLYSADKSGIQSMSPLVITIPTAMGIGTGSPTGTAYNPGNGPGPGPNNFAFATLDGTISNWNAGELPSQPQGGCLDCHVGSATVKVNNFAKGASYTGLTIATNPTTRSSAYYAANNNGRVEAYDAATFAPVPLTGRFTDPMIPAGYRAYGIQAVGARIWVTFFNGIAGGFVDAFDANGIRKVRLAQGSFSEPWGIVQ